MALFLFEEKIRRTNIDVKGDFCVITVRRLYTTWREVANGVAWKCNTNRPVNGVRMPRMVQIENYTELILSRIISVEGVKFPFFTEPPLRYKDSL